MRSGRNWGCGDFRDLLDVVDWVAEDIGASFVALNPLHAIHNRRPYNTSPYLPNCIYYRNFLYLDVEGMEDYAQCRRAQGLRRSPKETAEIEALRDSPFVEYERVSTLKMRFLKLVFAQFLREWRKGSPRAGEFEAFRIHPIRPRANTTFWGGGNRRVEAARPLRLDQGRDEG